MPDNGSLYFWIAGILASLIVAVGIGFGGWTATKLISIGQILAGLLSRQTSLEGQLHELRGGIKDRIDSIERRLEERSDKWIPVISSTEHRVEVIEQRINSLEHSNGRK